MKRPRETHRHDYTRPSASLSDEEGGLSTALGLFASLSLMLSTESVVVVEWKGMSTSGARQLQHPPGGPHVLQSTCSYASTPPSRLIRSKVSVMDLRRTLARCSIRPPHCPCTWCFVNSCAHASHGLFVTSPRGHACRPSTRHAVFGAEDGHWSSFTHLLRAVRLSLERVGQSFSSIRNHGPEQCRFRTCALHLLRSAGRGRPGCNRRAHALPLHHHD